jgi:ABC-type amino acid transport system permease subunit
MASAQWMHENEALAAILFIAVSLALMGLFDLLERRFKRR